MKLSISYLVIGLLLFFHQVYMHEKVHVAIFESYGIESKIHLLKYFPDVATTVSSIDYNEKCTESCKLAHDVNEVVGYHLQTFVVLIYLSFLYIILLLEENKKNKDENENY